MEQMCGLNNGMWHSGMWIFPMIGCCIMMCFICAIVFFSRRWFGGSCFGHPFSRHYSKSALEILNKRYASGEITKEEYEQIKSDIS